MKVEKGPQKKRKKYQGSERGPGRERERVMKSCGGVLWQKGGKNREDESEGRE